MFFWGLLPRTWSPWHFQPARRITDASSWKLWACARTVSAKGIQAVHLQHSWQHGDLTEYVPTSCFLSYCFQGSRVQTKSDLEIWQRLELFIAIFIAAPMFICAFPISIRQKKVPIRHCLGGMALKAAAGISCACSEQQLQIFVACESWRTLPHVSGPCFFFYTFREGLKFHPIRCAQLQLFWIYQHASKTLRKRFFGVKKGIWTLPWIF